MATKFTLNKRERLKSKKLIEELFISGKKLYAHPLKLVYILREKPEGQPPILFSVSVPKKKFPAAVDRNQIKRRVREAYRLNKVTVIDKQEQSQLQVVCMFIQTSDYVEEYRVIEKTVSELLNKLGLRIGQKTKASN